MSREVRRSLSQSQDAWRKIEGREDYSRRRSVSRDKEAAERRSISKGLRSIASKSRERSLLERIQESSEEEEEDEETIVAKRSRRRRRARRKSSQEAINVQR